MWTLSLTMTAEKDLEYVYLEWDTNPGATKEDLQRMERLLNQHGLVVDIVVGEQTHEFRDEFPAVDDVDGDSGDGWILFGDHHEELKLEWTSDLSQRSFAAATAPDYAPDYADSGAGDGRTIMEQLTLADNALGVLPGSDLEKMADRRREILQEYKDDREVQIPETHRQWSFKVTVKKEETVTAKIRPATHCQSAAADCQELQKLIDDRSVLRLGFGPQ